MGAVNLVLMRLECHVWLESVSINFIVLFGTIACESEVSLVCLDGHLRAWNNGNGNALIAYKIYSLTQKQFSLLNTVFVRSVLRMSIGPM